MTYEQRRDFLLKMMKKQTDHWLQEDKYEQWQKKNKPKQSYTFKPQLRSRQKSMVSHQPGFIDAV